MIEDTDRERVASVRIKNVTVGIYPGSDPTRMAADGLISFAPATANTDGDSAAHNRTAESRATFSFLSGMGAVNDAPLFSTVVLPYELAVGEVGPSNVLYVKGTQPLQRVLEAALFTADDNQWQTVVLPLAPLSGDNDPERLLKTAYAVGQLLEAHDLTYITHIKLVQPTEQESVTVLVAKAVCAGAPKSYARKTSQPRPTCNLTLQVGTIEDAEVDALIACIRSSDERAPFAIEAELTKLVGEHFHEQLAGKAKIDGRSALTRGGLRGVPFRSVLFLVNDGKKSGAEYIECVLRAADDLGLKVVSLPLLSFVEDPNDEVALGKVIDDLREGMKNFFAGGWRSLELVAAIVPAAE